MYVQSKIFKKYQENNIILYIRNFWPPCYQMENSTSHFFGVAQLFDMAILFVIIDPPGHGRIGGHYFHTWYTSMVSKNLLTSTPGKQKTPYN